MTDDNSDGIFELTTILLVGQEVEYKFQLDQWNVEESLTAGSPCTKLQADSPTECLLLREILY